MQVMLFDHIRDQWNLLSAMFGVWTEDEFLVACRRLGWMVLWNPDYVDYFYRAKPLLNLSQKENFANTIASAGPCRT